MNHIFHLIFLVNFLLMIHYILANQDVLFLFHFVAICLGFIHRLPGLFDFDKMLIVEQ